MKTATKYIFQWYDNVNTIEFPISVRNSQQRVVTCMHFEKMQRREYHFQSEWVSPPARLIFRSICGQQVSVAIAARLLSRLTVGRSDRMPILMRLRVAAVIHRPSSVPLSVPDRTNEQRKARGRCFHAESFSQRNGRNGDPLHSRRATPLKAPNEKISGDSGKQTEEERLLLLHAIPHKVYGK